MASWTLTEAAKLLRVPQHRLIHLCEQRVVVPDVRDARGRGSSRQFSKRNLFDFAIALAMRDLELPVSYVRAVLGVLRAFEDHAKALLGEFMLPESLLTHGAPGVRLVILDGERLYFSVTSPNESVTTFGGVNVRHPQVRGRARRHEGIGRVEPGEMEEARRSARIKTEVDLSRIAHELDHRLPRG